jgi:hypothetical protein
MFLNFVGATALSSNVTFTRGSNATLVDSTGKITYAPANLLTYSEQFDNAAWVKSAVTVTANATTAPDGTTTADKIAETSATSEHSINNGVASVASTVYTGSVYLKASERTVARVSFANLANGSVWFDLSAGTVGTKQSAVTTATITAVGNGWYRCAATWTANGVSNFFTVGPATADNVATYAGTTGSGVFAWGAQLEPVTYQTTPSTYVATTTAAYYGPRFDYDPVTLAAKGLLIEEQRTNFTLHSGTTAANWGAVGGTIANTGKISPDGSANMLRFTEDTATSQHQTFVTPAVPGLLPFATTHTASAYLAAGTRRYVVVHLGTNTDGMGVTVDTTNWTITGSYSIGSGVYASSTITNAGNGIYRVTVTGLFTGGISQAYVVLAGSLISNATGPNTSYLGNGSTFFVWGTQVEAGAFATSYIPTVASQVTRSADNASMTGTNFSSWYNQSEGTFATQVSLLNISSGHLLTAFQGYSDLMRIRPLSSIPTANITVGGVSQFDSTSQGSLSAITTNEIFSSALAYKQNDTSFAAKGVSVSTDTSVNLVAAPSRLAIGSLDNSGSGNMSGHIRQIAYYNTRLPNATLQALTT